MSVLKKPYYSTSELAEMCSVSSTTIFRAIINKQIAAATTPGGHFRIPREAAEIFLKKNKLTLDTAIGTKRILIIENNPVELRLFRRTLSIEKNFDIQISQTGYTAGFLTQSYKPHLIILDIFLDGVDGRDVAKLVREEPSLKKTKIVAITGTKDPKEMRSIKTASFDAIIQKPIQPLEFLKTIKDLLE